MFIDRASCFPQDALMRNTTSEKIGPENFYACCLKRRT
ncbi:hypothetical protein SS05631_a47680 (plasmid) [Sinorhizobium sp. CCBAU 05631]|nr:hypothetical protein SS05631_a47570 [Sinorhizobium sp. CCBAU 05631]ASY61151.1 hypothetical protein SS05631_a47680 [Sinorhizobium sp. CCBAU 05631]